MKQTRIQKFLPIYILFLMAMQPVLDVISYFFFSAGKPTTISLALRIVLLVVTTLLGFLLSDRKKVYWITAAVMAGYYVLHAVVCSLNGFLNPISDITNFVHIGQFVAFTLCFITFLRRTEETGYHAFEAGFSVSLGIIITVEIISVLTNTNPYTYANKGIGIMGWFYWPNTQSAIMTSLIPIAMLPSLRSGNKKWIVFSVAVLFAELFFYATRLAYLSIFACAVGFILVMLMAKKFDKFSVAVLLIGAVICGALYPVSPTRQNQLAQRVTASEAQQQIDEMIAKAEKENNTTLEESPELVLRPVYDEYLDGMVIKFGYPRTMEIYNYTTNAVELKDWRRLKLQYCDFLMEDAGLPGMLLGTEAEDMVIGVKCFDPENEVQGIYYRYGIVGTVLLFGFLFYFLWIIGKALVTDFNRYMTLEAGAFGISLAIILIHIVFTMGVLRRSNGSFYLSVVLAVAYYLVKIKQYPEKERS